MCPDPALLVAYLDGTLFSRDAILVDQHISTCERCAALLASMRSERVVAMPPLWRRPWAVGAASGVVAIAVIGTWLIPSGSKGTPDIETPARSGIARPPPVTSDPAAVAPTPRQELKVPVAPVVTQPAPRPDPVATERLRSQASSKTPPKPRKETEKPQPGKEIEMPAVIIEPPVEPVASPDQAAGVIVRGRKANSRIVWRTRDLLVEHSTDGGATWVAEHTSDRPIRAGSVVDANVAWMVGENGLVLRRTKNGWFGTNPPAEGHINAVRASSPSKATLTLDDGRVFNTEDGGVTWSAR